jgi:hypothetical protein
VRGGEGGGGGIQCSVVYFAWLGIQPDVSITAIFFPDINIGNNNDKNIVAGNID